MMSIKQIFFLVLIFILSISSINAEESDESRKLKAESADKHIRFISPAEFSVHINKGLWIIMYGANWCKYTQKLTPKWLGLQTRIRAEGLGKDINIAKVECNKDNNMDFCTSQGIDGFPTIYVYENGKKYEEYLGNHEINEMFTYVQEQVARYKSEEVVEEVVTVYVEEVVYEDEMEENKPRKSSREDGEQYQNKEANKPKPNAKQLPKKKNSKNPPPSQKAKNPPPSHQRVPPKNNQQQQNRPQPRNNNNQKNMKQAPKYPPKNAPPKYNPPKYNPPKYDRRPLPPKKNIVVKATKKVFGLVESLITLAVVLIVIYAIVRFKAIKRHSSYSKTKIPLYRDLTQEEKYMLHYS